MVESYIKEKIKKYLDEGIPENKIVSRLLYDSIKDAELHKDLSARLVTHVKGEIMDELEKEGYKPKKRKANK